MQFFLFPAFSGAFGGIWVTLNVSLESTDCEGKGLSVPHRHSQESWKYVLESSVIGPNEIAQRALEEGVRIIRGSLPSVLKASLSHFRVFSPHLSNQLDHPKSLSHPAQVALHNLREVSQGLLPTMLKWVYQMVHCLLALIKTLLSQLDAWVYCTVMLAPHNVANQFGRTWTQRDTQTSKVGLWCHIHLNSRLNPLLNFIFQLHHLLILQKCCLNV